MGTCHHPPVLLTPPSLPLASRPTTAPLVGSKSLASCVQRPHTTPHTEGGAREWNRGRFQPREVSRTCWRWRVGMTDTNWVSPGGSRGSSPISPEAARTSTRKNRSRILNPRRGCGCYCPMESCRTCSPTQR